MGCIADRRPGFESADDRHVHVVRGHTAVHGARYVGVGLEGGRGHTSLHRRQPSNPPHPLRLALLCSRNDGVVGDGTLFTRRGSYSAAVLDGDRHLVTGLGHVSDVHAGRSLPRQLRGGAQGSSACD